MKAQKPLLSDPGLRSELQADLNEYARATTRYDVERGAAVFASTVAALGMASQASAVEAAPSAAPGALTAASGKLALLPAVKATLVVVGCALLGLASVQLLDWRRDNASSPAIHANPSGTAQPGQPSVRSEQPLEVSSPVTAVAPIEPTGTASRREIESLLRIRDLLPRDPEAAYRLARAAEREFPSGALREEREGLTIIALFSLGDGAHARREAARYIARYPMSSLRERIEQLANR